MTALADDWQSDSLWRADLEALAPLHRLIVRSVLLAGRGRLLSVSGLDRVSVAADPFILVANHSTRLEAVLLPAWLLAFRGGRRIRFLADWNFQLIPGVSLLYAAADVIVVPSKPARPRALEVFRPLLVPSIAPYEAARRTLLGGSSVALFPEGTVNRDRSRLLRGRLGAARLACDTGVPVVPVGISFPLAPPFREVPESSPMRLEIGPALLPRPDEVPQRFHVRIMDAIASLSGKLSPRS